MSRSISSSPSWARCGSRRAAVGTRIACTIWVVAAVLWTVFDWPNLWGPEPGPLLVVFAVLGSAMILWAFADGARRAAGGAAEAA